MGHIGLSTVRGASSPLAAFTIVGAALIARALRRRRSSRGRSGGGAHRAGAEARDDGRSSVFDGPELASRGADLGDAQGVEIPEADLVLRVRGGPAREGQPPAVGRERRADQVR
jgi:hypothetical protein